MPFDFSGKKILVTGAGGGIGRELAKAIANAGGEVYALGRTKENIESLAGEVNNVHPILADLSDWESTRKVLNELEVMDGVVNNAAIFRPFCDSLSIEKERLVETLNINLMGAINVTQVTAKKMINAGRKGSIVNVSSIAGVQAHKYHMDYCVSKAALDMVTKQFALEIGPHNIRVNSVNPTWVWTEGVKESMRDNPEFYDRAQSIIPLGRFCELNEAVDPILYLLSEHSSMVNGTVNPVDGGLLSNIPI